VVLWELYFVIGCRSFSFTAQDFSDANAIIVR